jgi:cell division inhibitor SulA/protein ImuA
MSALKKVSVPLSKQDLLKHPLLWRGQQLTQPGSLATLSTGFALLDKHLPGNGWPLGGLIDLLLANAGIGELRLLLPALAKLQDNPHGTWSIWINPPFVPYAPALQAAGINRQQLLLVHPKTHEDFLWSVENACKSASCGIVLAWPFTNKLKPQDTRRIQIAAKQNHTLACLFQPLTKRHNNSMAELRLALHPGESSQHLLLDICKRRGGWPLEQLQLVLTEATTATHTNAEHVQKLFMRWQIEYQQHQEMTRLRKIAADDSVLGAAIDANLLQPHASAISNALH